MGFPRRGSIVPKGLRRLGSTGTVSCAFGREGPNQTVWGGLGKSQHGGALLGWAPRDRACARRDRTGGGAIALPRCGNGVLRSNARSGPIPLQPGLSRGARGKELLQNREGLVGDRLFGERVGNETLGGVLLLGGGSAGHGLRGLRRLLKNWVRRWRAFRSKCRRKPIPLRSV